MNGMYRFRPERAQECADLPRTRRSAQSRAGCCTARRGRARGCRGGGGAGGGGAQRVLGATSRGALASGAAGARAPQPRACARARARAHTRIHRHTKANTRPLCTSRHCRWDTVVYTIHTMLSTNKYT